MTAIKYLIEHPSWPWWLHNSGFGLTVNVYQAYTFDTEEQASIYLSVLQRRMLIPGFKVTEHEIDYPQEKEAGWQSDV